MAVWILSGSAERSYKRKIIRKNGKVIYLVLGVWNRAMTVTENLVCHRFG